MSTKYVYVVVAMEDCGKVKECFVRSDMNEAMALRDTLADIYGGANVCLASRAVDMPLPARIVKHRVDTQLEGIFQGI